MCTLCHGYKNNNRQTEIRFYNQIQIFNFLYSVSKRHLISSQYTAGAYVHLFFFIPLILWHLIVKKVIRRKRITKLLIYLFLLISMFVFFTLNREIFLRCVLVGFTFIFQQQTLNSFKTLEKKKNLSGFCMCSNSAIFLLL